MLMLHATPGERLLAHQMQAGVLRPWVGKNGKSYVTLKDPADSAKLINHEIMVNASLRKDEWKAMDDALVMATRQRLTGVDTLLARGLVFTLDGMSKTVLETENANDFTEAQLSMDGLTPAEKDRMNFELVGLPLPIVSKDFHLSSRVLAASRATGQPLDTTSIGSATFKVKEKMEELLVAGDSNLKFNGYVLQGFTNLTGRNQYSVTKNWDDSAATGETILGDVLGMKAALIADGYYGPFGIFIPTNWEVALDNDFKAATKGTIRERLLAVAGIEFIQVMDRMTTDNCVMTQLTTDVVRIVNGMAIQPIQWDTLGGMSLHYKIMGIQVPQLRLDQNGNCGFVHAT